MIWIEHTKNLACRTHRRGAWKLLEGKGFGDQPHQTWALNIPGSSLLQGLALAVPSPGGYFPPLILCCASNTTFSGGFSRVAQAWSWHSVKYLHSLHHHLPLWHLFSCPLSSFPSGMPTPGGQELLPLYDYFPQHPEQRVAHSRCSVFSKWITNCEVGTVWASLTWGLNQDRDDSNL